MAQVQYKIKGIDNRTPLVGTGMGYARTMTNLRVFNGSLQLMYGKSRLTSSALNAGAAIRGATSWKDTADANVYAVVVCGTKLYTAPVTTDTGSLTWTERTGAVSIQTLGGKTFDSLNGLLILGGGSVSGEVLIKMTANTSNAANLAGTPPLGDAVKTVNNYLFVGAQRNSTSTLSTVNWSNVDDPETWPAANTVNFRKNDGDEVTALGAVGTDLIIFKKGSIGKLSTTGISVSGVYTLGPLVTLSDRIGCPALLGCDTLPDGTLVFLGNDFNLYRCDGNTIERLNEDFNIYNSTASIGSMDQSFYCLKVDPSSNEIRIRGGFVYNYLNKYWYIDSECNTATNLGELSFFTVGTGRTSTILTTGSPVLFCCGTSDGHVTSYASQAFPYPSIGTGAGTAVAAGITFDVPLKEIGFIPRFMKVMFYNVVLPTNTVANFGWDGISGTNVTVVAGTYTTVRTIQWAIPQVRKSDNYSPLFLTVTLSNIYSATVDKPGFSLWFSDEDTF